ncbi:hypothetical protein AC790_02270 [Pantoea sp. RIT-PI-b]|nr:hypothetical protein AC790_02270 [Pantoea sp. RIT-PI-b]
MPNQLPGAQAQAFIALRLRDRVAPAGLPFQSYQTLLTGITLSIAEMLVKLVLHAIGPFAGCAARRTLRLAQIGDAILLFWLSLLAGAER